MFTGTSWLSNLKLPCRWNPQAAVKAKKVSIQDDAGDDGCEFKTCGKEWA